MKVEQTIERLEDRCIIRGDNDIQMLDQDLDNILFNDCEYFMCLLSLDASWCSSFISVGKNEVNNFTKPSPF